MKIVFIGGGEWGSEVLGAAIKSGHDVTAVDSPAVNGKKVDRLFFLKPFLHENLLLQKVYLTLRNNIFYQNVWAGRLPVIVTPSINSKKFIEKLQKMKPDLILVASCSEILSESLCSIPSLGAINCHPSKLPQYRGPDPFYWVIKNKEKATGVTFHYVDSRLDCGDIILQRQIDISSDDDEKSLIAKVRMAIRSLCPEVLSLVAQGKVSPICQDEKVASYYSSFGPADIRNFHVSEVDDKTWGDIVKVSDQYNVFSNPSWLRLLSEVTGNSFKIFAVFNKDVPICGCAAIVKNTLEGKLFTSAPLSQYSSVLLFQQSNAVIYYKAVLRLLAHLKNSFDRIVLYLHPTFDDKVIFLKNGWGVEDRYTYYIDLRDKDRLHAQFDDSLKRQIRKGSKNGFIIEAGRPWDERFYESWSRTFQRQGIRPPLGRKSFNKVFTYLKDSGIEKTLTAYDKNGCFAAGVIFLIENKKAYYWASTLSEGYESSGINQLLMWEGLQSLSENGIDMLDFVGADIPSIASYKKKFGGVLTRHYAISVRSSIRSRLIGTGKNIYKAVVR